MVKITIDDREYETEKDMTVLQVARANGLRIPTLCYHPSLETFRVLPVVRCGGARAVQRQTDHHAVVYSEGKGRDDGKNPK